MHMETMSLGHVYANRMLNCHLNTDINSLRGLFVIKKDKYLSPEIDGDLCLFVHNIDRTKGTFNLDV